MLVGLPMGSREKLPNEVLGKYRLLIYRKNKNPFQKGTGTRTRFCQMCFAEVENGGSD
jgi:hypothetical protein